MKAYEVKKDMIGNYYRTYKTNTHFNTYFSLDVNLKKKGFDLWFVEKYQSNYWFSLDNPKQILDKLGYNLKDFTDFTCVECFIDAVVDMIKNENFRGLFVSTAFIRSYDLQEYNLL